jgi:hypothetical protein
MYYQYTFVLVRLARLALLSLEPPRAFVVEKKNNHRLAQSALDPPFALVGWRKRKNKAPWNRLVRLWLRRKTTAPRLCPVRLWLRVKMVQKQ